ncbi:MAG: hypothetical protein CMD16_03530 [Flavobacteriales bacterium]|nr:hypothetical protein [Flavobacteriales bacterium]|tara:strand:+ start:21095 stop:21472 length:378 start_codon:yes stop_codon:yes gene_type:complete
MLNRIFKTVILGVFSLLIITSITSCKKAKDTIGVIIVKDANGLTVPGAYVTLHQDSLISPQGNYTNSDLKKTDYTDVNGRAEFTYELEAILNVEVRKTDGNNVYTGSNIIRLLKQKTVTKVVEIN